MASKRKPPALCRPVVPPLPLMGVTDTEVRLSELETGLNGDFPGTDSRGGHFVIAKGLCRRTVAYETDQALVGQIAADQGQFPAGIFIVDARAGMEQGIALLIARRVLRFAGIGSGAIPDITAQAEAKIAFSIDRRVIAEAPPATNLGAR